MSLCCLDSGSVDVASRFREERWHGASVALPCENDDGNNRAATYASAALSSSITTAFHRRHPGFLCFLTCCTTTVSPGFRSARDSMETSRSFTVTIDCTSCQKIRSSNLGELFLTNFIKTTSVRFAAMLYFTSPRLMNDVGGSHPLWRSWITSTMAMHQAVPRAFQSHPVSYPYHTGTAHIRPRSTYLRNSQTCTQTGMQTGTQTGMLTRTHADTASTIHVPKKAYGNPNNTWMPWSVPKRVPVNVPIGKRNPQVPWLLQYFLLVLYICGDG